MSGRIPIEVRAVLALDLIETIDAAITAADCATVGDVHDLLAGMKMAAKEASS